MNTEPEKRNVVVTRVFDAPVDRVWKAWVEPDLVKQWWGPEGFTCPLAEMDFREGGTSLVCMRAPKEFGGQDMYNSWTYEEIAPMKRLVYILRFTDKDGQAFDPAEMGLPPGIPKEVRNVNTFKDLGNGKTEMTITEHSYTSAQAHDLSKQGLEQCLDKMAAIFARAKARAAGSVPGAPAARLMHTRRSTRQEFQPSLTNKRSSIIEEWISDMATIISADQFVKRLKAHRSQDERNMHLLF